MFLWHFPHGRPHWELPSGLVFGSPDFPQIRTNCESVTPFADSLSLFSLVVLDPHTLGKFLSRMVRLSGIEESRHIIVATDADERAKLVQRQFLNTLVRKNRLPDSKR